MLETINGIDLLIALVGLGLAWVAYEWGRSTGKNEGYAFGYSNGRVDGIIQMAVTPGEPGRLCTCGGGGPLPHLQGCPDGKKVDGPVNEVYDWGRSGW